MDSYGWSSAILTQLKLHASGQLRLKQRHPAPALTQLVRQLLAHDGHGHADPQHDVVSEGRSDGQAVNEVVQAITKDHHVGHRGHLPVVVVVMAVVTVAIHCLLLVQDENVSSLKNDKRILYACLTHLHLCTYLHKDNYICCYVMCRYIFPRRYTCCYICVHTPMKIITSAVTFVYILPWR